MVSSLLIQQAITMSGPTVTAVTAHHMQTHTHTHTNAKLKFKSVMRKKKLAGTINLIIRDQTLNSKHIRKKWNTVL